MAAFQTHLLGAAVVSGLAATVVVMTDMAPQQAVVGYFALGVLGGLLPDIDSPSSIPVRIAFAMVAVVSGFLVVFTFGTRYSLVELVLLWLGGFLLIRGSFKLFNRYTVHRGLIHSLPAGAGFGLATTALAFHGFGASAFHAWMCGAFVALGFVVHLALDEWYSVDLYGKKLLKRSFGTALSLGRVRQPFGTVALYLMVIGLFFLCPSPRPFTERVLAPNTYRGLEQRLIPREFGVPQPPAAEVPGGSPQ